MDKSIKNYFSLQLQKKRFHYLKLVEIEASWMMDPRQPDAQQIRMT